MWRWWQRKFTRSDDDTIRIGGFEFRTVDKTALDPQAGPAWHTPRLPRIAGICAVILLSGTSCAFLLSGLSQGLQPYNSEYRLAVRLAAMHDLAVAAAPGLPLQAIDNSPHGPTCFADAAVNPQAVRAGRCHTGYVLRSRSELCRYSFSDPCFVTEFPMALMERPLFMEHLSRFLRDPCSMVDDVARLYAQALAAIEDRSDREQQARFLAGPLGVDEARRFDRTFGCNRAGALFQQPGQPLPSLKLDRHVISFRGDNVEVVMRIVPAIPRQ
jgi:hypothetical protein